MSKSMCNTCFDECRSFEEEKKGYIIETKAYIFGKQLQ